MQTYNGASGKVVYSDKAKMTEGGPVLSIQSGLTALVFLTTKRTREESEWVGETRFPSEYVTFRMSDRRSGQCVHVGSRL